MQRRYIQHSNKRLDNLMRTLQSAMRPRTHMNPNSSLDPCPLFLLLPSTIVLEDRIHLLQSAPIRLRNKEPAPHKRKRTKQTKEHVSPIPSILHKRRRNKPNNKIIQPIRHSRIRHPLSAQRRRKDLGRHSPRNRTPSRTIAEHENAQERNTDPALRRMSRPVGLVLAHENGDDEMRNCHRCRAAEE